ncbi:hypothetical protein L1987_69385 [Smallanthus sonchifolius]|uniref:Uncharacterized protein n=1 Tax=Smallanthus sonchifolius TaxID=185202 RepID=A0ACB9B6T9_9ASTR|nr:hypothetical protein L1987_69385 [Smallanthus sonchifolius]
MNPRFLQEVFNHELKDLSKPARMYLMLGHKNNIFQSMRTFSKKFSGVNVPLLSTMLNIQSTQGSGSHPGFIEQLSEPSLSISSLNLSVEAPSQDDLPSPTATFLKVLIDLVAKVPSPSSLPEKVHSGSDDRVNVEGAITTTGPSIDHEGSDNITKSPTTATHSEDGSFETLFTDWNLRRQENQGDGDEEARPKAPSSSKDSITMEEDRLKLKNLELTARVAMLEAEVSKLKHQAGVHT